MAVSCSSCATLQRFYYPKCEDVGAKEADVLVGEGYFPAQSAKAPNGSYAIIFLNPTLSSIKVMYLIINDEDRQYMNAPVDRVVGKCFIADDGKVGELSISKPVRIKQPTTRAI